MTDSLLGTANASVVVSPAIKRLGVSGPSTGAFSPNRKTWRWPDALSGEFDQLPIPVMLVSTSVTATGAILNASIDPQGLDCSVVFDYGLGLDTDGNPTFGTSTDPVDISAAFGGQTVSIPIASLVPDTLYFAQVTATNVNGPATSTPVGFHTDIDKPPSGPPIVFTGIALVGSPSQTAISMNVAYDMNLAAGQIHLERLVGPSYVDIVPPQAAPIGVQTMTATATGLTAGTSYTFRARATNPNAPEPGGTVSGPIVLSTAPPDPTLPLAVLLSAGVPGLTSEVVNARISRVTEVPVRYQFQYGLTAAYGSTTPLVTDSVLPPGGTEDVTATITGLASATTYHYRLVVMRIDGAGGNQFSADGIFTTATPPPQIPVPAINPATSITSSSAVLNGHINNIVEVPVKWRFNYGTVSLDSQTTLVTDAVIPAGGTETVSATLSGLLPSTLYQYQLSATRTDDIGGAQLSSIGTFTTTAVVAAVLPVAAPLAAASVTSSAATLNGRVAQVTAQSNVNYHFEYGTTTSYGTSTSTGVLTPTGVANVAVLVSGSVNPENLATQLVIDYGTDPDNLNQTVSYGQLVGTGSQAFSCIVSGLLSNTIYWFRARATNTGGTSISTMRPTRIRTPNTAPGSTVHVAVTGDNSLGDGTLAKPWKTIQKAVSVAGVTSVLLHAGQYPGQTVSTQAAALITITDAGDGQVDLDFLSLQGAGRLNFEGNIKCSGWSRPDLASTVIFEGVGTPSVKAGPIYWAAGNITAIGKVTGGTCIRASSDADNFYFDGTKTQGSGYGFRSVALTTPTTSYPTGWRFTGCEFGPDHTFDATNIGGAKNLRFIACTAHDVKSVSNWTG